MGCLSEREKGPTEQSQKWDYLNLDDFRCPSAWTVVAYVWLWLMAVVGIAVYAVDTFTAVNLLVFDRWSSQVKPALEFKYSKWIFAICILLSWLLCFYEWFQAIRVMKRGGVAESFLDPLAVTIQSIRPKGFRRFLVFNALTKSRKGADYVALFVYFSFNTAIRVILAEGPRVGVNAMTLYAVLRADLVHTVDPDHSSFEQFFVNIGALWEKDRRQTIIYFAMLFTMVIWAFSALSLIASAIVYITFLWHYIPQGDGRLSVYCRRKVDKRLERIVSTKVQKGIEEEERRKRMEEEKEELKRQKTGELPPPIAQIGIKKQPTLPKIGSPDVIKDDQLPGFTLRRQGTDSTVATLPPYSSRPLPRNGSDRLQRQPALPDLGENHPGMTRMNTAASAWSNAPSYATEAPLLHHVAMPGQSEQMPPMPLGGFTRQDSSESVQRPWHERSGSYGSQHSTPATRVQTPMSARPYPPGMGPGFPRAPPHPRATSLNRTMPAQAYEQEPQSATSFRGQDGYSRTFAPPPRLNTDAGFHTGPKVDESYWNSIQKHQSFSRPAVRQPANASFSRPYSPVTSQARPPPQHQHSYEMIAQPSHALPVSRAPFPAAGEYVAFNPAMTSPLTPAPVQPTLHEELRRNTTVAAGLGTDGRYFGDVRQVPQRSATAPIDSHYTEPMQHSVNDILDDYGPASEERISEPQQRSETVGPPPGNWRRQS